MRIRHAPVRGHKLKMDEQFLHPRGSSLLAEVRTIFEKKPIFQNAKKPVIFLCGGPLKTSKRNMRREFLRWSSVELPGVVTLLAEDAYGHTKLFDPPETVNLSEFEEVIGTISDCILVFPESEGSFAELGLFSHVGDVSEKMLVANAIAYQAKDSFINLGPIKTIDGISYLGPTIQIAKRYGRFDFEPLRDRLERLMERARRKSFQYAPYRRLDYLGKFLITLEMINIFQVLTLESLGDCIRSIFDTARSKELKRILSILAGAGYIRVHDGFFFLAKGKDSLLEFDDVRIETLKARALNYYQEHRPDLYRRFQRR
jgi:hypothetical protein